MRLWIVVVWAVGCGQTTALEVTEWPASGGADTADPPGEVDRCPWSGQYELQVLCGEVGEGLSGEADASDPGLASDECQLVSRLEGADESYVETITIDIDTMAARTLGALVDGSPDEAFPEAPLGRASVSVAGPSIRMSFDADPWITGCLSEAIYSLTPTR